MEESSPNGIRIVLPGSSAATPLPSGWSLGQEARPLLTVVSPEGDLRVAFASGCEHAGRDRNPGMAALRQQL
jgi:hypothetical protein